MLLLLLIVTGAAHGGGIEIVPGSAGSDTCHLNADGRYIAFTLNAPNTPPSGNTVFIYDRKTGSLTEIPDAKPGQANGTTAYPTLNATGSVVTFQTTVGLTPYDGNQTCDPPTEDCNSGPDVYRYVLATSASERVTLTTDQRRPNNGSPYGAGAPLAVSADGLRVVFASDAPYLVAGDTNNFLDYFLRDYSSPAAPTRRVSVGSGGVEGNNNVELGDRSVAISADGRFVAFVSQASNLVSDDTNGKADVFVHEIAAGTTTRVSLTTDGGQLARGAGLAAISGEGRYVVFAAVAPEIDPAASNVVSELFIHDRETRATTLITRRPPACTYPGTGTSGPAAISADGTIVVFMSVDPCLIPDPPGLTYSPSHIYSWNRTTRLIERVSQGLDGGTLSGGGMYPQLSLDGNRVCFVSSTTDLVPDAGLTYEPFLNRTYVAPAFRDRDGDGLPDDWETNGIDVNGDGVIDLNLPALGANPDRKDIFVEVDYMRAADHSHRPSATAIGQVTRAFRQAPVVNPDGGVGVTLHVDVDEGIGESAANARLATDFSDFDALKTQRFGTVAERTSANWANIREAKRLVFRYALVGHMQKNPDGTDNLSSGRGEIGGNDFIVSLGTFAGQVGTVDEQAATFMHELGHTLGLRHGGSDNLNCKPNYLSIMSYSFQFPYLVPDRSLNYSSQKLADLVETSLSEPAGVGGPGGYKTVFGPPVPRPDGGTQAVVVAADGLIDWNQNGVPTETGVSRNVTNVKASCADSAANETLVSHDDWSNLVYNFRGSADFADGMHTTVTVSEYTSVDRDEAISLAPYPANQPPTADAGASQRAAEGTPVSLAGGGSDPEGAPLSYLWAQASGPSVALSGADAGTASFTAPYVTADTDLVFELAVHDGQFWSAPAFVAVTVFDTGAEPPDADAGSALGSGKKGCKCDLGQTTGTGGIFFVIALLALLVLRFSPSRRRSGCVGEVGEAVSPTSRTTPTKT